MKIRWKLLGAVALIGILSIPVCWLTPKGPKVDEDAIRAAASSYDVRIIRDQWGVPHIFGKTDADASFGFGYAHAEDDWKHIQESLMGARGMSAQYKGKDSAPQDYLYDLFKVREAVEAKYLTHLKPETRAIIKAYADAHRHRL